MEMMESRRPAFLMKSRGKEKAGHATRIHVVARICKARSWRQYLLWEHKNNRHPNNHLSQSREYPKSPFCKTFNLRIFTLILLVALSYLSMSFLSRFLRPFTTMSSAPSQPMNVPAGAQTATIAAGCFWGVEHMYRKSFAGKGLIDARVGYIGGDSKDPSYRSVCSGRTGRTYILCLKELFCMNIKSLTRRVL
jgi:hypothetical protein